MHMNIPIYLCSNVIMSSSSVCSFEVKQNVSGCVVMLKTGTSGETVSSTEGARIPRLS